MDVAAEKKDSAKSMMDALAALEKEIGSALDTLEIISDKSTLDSIEKGIADIKDKRVVSFDDFLKKYGRK